MQQSWDPTGIPPVRHVSEQVSVYDQLAVLACSTEAVDAFCRLTFLNHTYIVAIDKEGSITRDIFATQSVDDLEKLRVTAVGDSSTAGNVVAKNAVLDTPT